jgi:hypothetical protein
MTTIIFYFDNRDLVGSTLEDLCDKTKLDDIEQILICNDSGQLFEDLNINDLIKDKIQIIDSVNVGRAKAWSIAAHKIVGDVAVFVGGTTKFTCGWLEPLIRELDDKSIVSPIINSLDTFLWQTGDICWEKFGWRWDFELRNRQYTQTRDTLSISSACFAISKNRLEQIGGFDTGMDNGCCEDIELSYRNWIFGGSCVMVGDSHVSTAFGKKSAAESLRNINRIIQAWLPEYESYMNDYYGNMPDAGRISNLLDIAHLRVYDNRTILGRLQPELFGIHKLRKIASGKSLAIVAPGASADFIHKSAINRHDLVIGIDYIGMLYDCDYVITDCLNVMSELEKKYQNHQFILPITMQNKMIGKYESANDAYPGSYIFEQNEYGNVNIGLNSPFVDVGNISITAINIALFLNPSIINLYGFDNRLLNGKSHVSNDKYYDNGEIWPDSESTTNRYKFYEYVMNNIGDLAIKIGIPVIKHGHL